jgi:TIR domain
MDTRYLVVSPVIFGKYHQDEVLTARQLGDNVAGLLAKGAIRELGDAESVRLNDLSLKVFVLPTNANTFASWMATVTGTNRICSANFWAEVGHHLFPIGDGQVTAGRSEPMAAAHPDGYLRVAVHSIYVGVQSISVSDLQKHEPISFRILTLPGDRIRVQARCGIEALAGYFNALLAQIQVRWPEADLQSGGEQDQAAGEANSISSRRAVRPLKLMFCYSHNNKRQRNEVDKHLTLMKRNGLVEIWYDRMITAGSEWVGKIDEHLNGSDIIMMLISADFIASNYCFDVEMNRALERHRAGEARVIPIILRKCVWLQTPLSELQALPDDGLPVDQWSRSNDAYHNIAEGIQKSVDELRANMTS